MTWDVLRYDTVDSTNNVCKALAAQGLDSTAVIARAQTAGKGRLGRSFQSPEGGLYLSALWQDCPAGQLLTVTPLAAVAVCRAVESLCDTDCGIKWCNDVVLHGKKLCGKKTPHEKLLLTRKKKIRKIIDKDSREKRLSLFLVLVRRNISILLML